MPKYQPYERYTPRDHKPVRNYRDHRKPARRAPPPKLAPKRKRRPRVMDLARLRKSLELRRAAPPGNKAGARRARPPLPPAKPGAREPRRLFRRAQRAAPVPAAPRAPVRRAPLPSVSSFNSGDYSELFGAQSSDYYGHRAVPRRPAAGRSPRGSVVPSVGPQPGRRSSEPAVVVIDGAQVGGGGRIFDAEALRAAVHHYTARGMRAIAIVPTSAISNALPLADAAMLRTDALRGRVVFTPPTSRHDLFVRDMARRHDAFVVSNALLPHDLRRRVVNFVPAPGSFRPSGGMA